MAENEMGLVFYYHHYVEREFWVAACVLVCTSTACVCCTFCCSSGFFAYVGREDRKGTIKRVGQKQKLPPLSWPRKTS